jgi:hypothetical protein
MEGPGNVASNVKPAFPLNLDFPCCILFSHIFVLAMAQLAWRKRMLPVLSLLLYSTSASAESSYIASCPNIHDSLTNPLPSTCPVAQDGYTYTSFPWTHNPLCADVVLATDDDTSSTSQLFCTYTNAAFNNGRGISFVVSPEVAMSISFETFGMAVGGLDGEIGEAMGVWEVKETEEMGKGMFAKQDVAAIFGGESFVSKTPVVLVSKQFLDLASTAQGERMLRRAVEQLPEKTRGMLEELAKTRGGSDAVDVVLTNGIAVKWPWVDDVPVLLAVTPEVAVRASHDPNEALKYVNTNTTPANQSRMPTQRLMALQ